HLTLTLLGPGLGTGFGPAGGSSLSLAEYQPPWEIEIRFSAPDDTIPWNFWMNFAVVDRDGKNRGVWAPGVENFPRERRHRPYGRSPFKVEFDREVPESVLAHKPVTMLIQCLDSRRVRLGFRAGSADAWVLSRVHDLGRVLGKDVARFDMHD